MSETTWVLKGIEPAARQQAIDEAARRGISLADHLTDIVLQNALAEQVRSHGAALLAEADGETAIFSPPEEPREAFAIRHRLKGLEKRLSASVGSIDGAIHALDGALFDLTTRVGEVEALAGDSAHSFAHALQELHGNLAALRVQLTEGEELAAADAERNQAAHLELADACGELDQRIDGVEQIARGADGAAAALAVQQEALRQAVASDLDTLAQDTTERLGEGLHQVRDAADAAARHADAAAAHVVNELRTLREAIDSRLDDHAAETKSRMHAAFVDAADRMAALADRVLDSERTQTRATDQLRTEISNAEDAAQTALEETADSLRRADAHLSADLIRARDAAEADIEGVRADLTREADDMRERHLGALARLAQVEAALASAGDDTRSLRDSIASRIAALSNASHDALAKTESHVRERLDALTAHALDADEALAETRQALSADTARVEACTLAALEKLNNDRVTGHAALQRDLDGVFTATRASIADARDSFDTGVAGMRGQHAALQARLDVVDTALTAIAPLQIAVAEIPALKTAAAAVAELKDAASQIPDLRRATQAIPALQIALARIEGTSPDRTFEIDVTLRVEALEQADEVNRRLRAQLDAIAAQLAMQQAQTPAALDELHARATAQEARIGVHESAVSEAADSLHNVARMLGKLSTQSAELETQSNDRLHKLEVGFADLRLGQLSATDHADKASIETITIINARIADIENRSGDALEGLRTQIAHFVDQTTGRLGALEAAPAPALPERPFADLETRLEELELRDLGAEFIELRRRIDDRILGLEQRSINALERVCDSVALIEQKLSKDDADGIARSA